MKKTFTILIAAIAAILMITQPVKVVGQERAITMGSGYTVINTVLTSVSNNDLVVWGTSNTSLGYVISSNKLACNSTSSNWIVFKVIEGTNGFYLQNTDDNKYVYSSAAKKIEFHATSKTLFTIVDKGSDHTNILYGANVSGNTTTNIGYYTYNNDASGIRPYASNVYTDAHLYKVIPPHTLNYSATNGNITGVNSSTSATVNTGASLAYGTVVNLTANPADGYEFESWSDGGTNTLSNINGNHATFTMGEANVTIIATFTQASSDPTITATPASLIDFSCVQNSGNPSASQSFAVSGANLDANISVSIADNSDFEMSAQDGENWSSTTSITLNKDGNNAVAETNIYVRMKASTSAGDKSGSVTISSTNATTRTIQLSGTVLAAKTITWHHGAGGASTSTTNTYVGATLTELPTAATVNGWTFIGWAASYSSGYPVTVTAPLTVTAGMGDFHAVYRHGNNVIYQLTTSTSDLSAGTRYMMGYYSSGYLLMTTNFAGTSAISLDASNQYTYTAGTQWTLGGSNNAWTFTDANGKLLSSQSTTYSYAYLKLESTATDYSYWSISYDDASPKHSLIQNNGNVSNNSKELKVSYYTSGSIFECQNNAVVYLFKEVTEYSTAPTVDKCYVTYDGNDATSGDVPTDGTGYNQGASVTVAGQNTLAKTGYTWSGWCLNNAGTGTVYGPEPNTTTYTIQANTTFYAKWNINSYEYTLDDSDEHVAAGLEVGGESYTASEIPYNTEVEVVVTPAANYGYTISVKDADDHDVPLTNNTFNMPASTVTITVTSRLLHTYTLVTEASQLVSGRHYIIASGATGSVSAMGSQNNGHYRNVVSPVTSTSGVISETEGVYEFVINGPEIITKNNNSVMVYTIYDVTGASGGYLYASSSGSNYMDTQAFNNNNGKWTISIANTGAATIEAQGTNTRYKMRFNSDRFSCYGDNTSVSNLPYLYVKNEVTPQYDFYMDIAAWTVSQTTGDENKTDGWYFIASPINSNNMTPASVTNMIAETAANYDLYRLSGNTLENYKNENTYDFVIANGVGYLYANKSNTTLRFSGSSVKTYSTDDNTVTPSHSGWNLIGNPYTFPVKVSRAFSELDNGSAVTSKDVNSVINPGAGIIVYGTADVTFTKYEPAAQSSGPSNINIMLVQQVAGRDGSSTTSVNIDNAVVSFNENSSLPKFTMLEGNAKLYIPQNGEDYSIAFSNRQGDMPLNFKTTETGNYTISFEGNNMDLRGIYLIDMLAGQEIDLSVNPSYTFIGSPVDKAERFKIVFKNVGSNGEDIFAYQNGNDIIVSGEGELQIFDVTGRSVMTTTISGVETINVPTMGVYIFRLIGSEIKTQKIVVR